MHDVVKISAFHWIQSRQNVLQCFISHWYLAISMAGSKLQFLYYWNCRGAEVSCWCVRVVHGTSVRERKILWDASAKFSLAKRFLVIFCIFCPTNFKTKRCIRGYAADDVDVVSGVTWELLNYGCGLTAGDREGATTIQIVKNSMMKHLFVRWSVLSYLNLRDEIKTSSTFAA